MFQSGRVMGIVLMAAGGLFLMVATLWGVGNMMAGSLQMTGFMLLLALVLPVELALLGGGYFVYTRAGTEAVEMAGVQKQRKILNMVQTRGQVQISEAALETGMSRDEVQNAIYDLVGKGLFTGYIDWDQGTLFSRQARQLREAGSCPNCGGSLALAGKGVIKCPYCGTEIFL